VAICLFFPFAGVANLVVRLQLRKKNALFIAHVGPDKVCETPQAIDRPEVTEAGRKHAQFGMLRQDPLYRLCIQGIPRKLYQPLFPL
jgi:hypothetical protein